MKHKIPGKTAARRVLIVEDEEECERLLEKAIGAVSGAARIKWVRTAEEAEKLLNARHEFDLIIADHFLDGVETGFEFWKTCHKRRGRTPFLMTSSISMDTFDTMVDVEEGRPIFLHKPFLMKDCRNLIEWCLGEGMAADTPFWRHDERTWVKAQIFAATIFALLLALVTASSLILSGPEVSGPSLVLPLPAAGEAPESQ